MGFDGTLKFDTAIDQNGFKSGIANLGNLAKKGMAVVTGAVAAATAATAALSGAIISGVSNIAAYGDNIDKMSQKLGMSSTAYQEWDAVMQHCGTSIDSMQAGMKTLASAAETNSDVFKQLGITQEQLADLSQEELFSATITALQNVENETERTYLAGKLLGKGATELGALLNTSAEDTEKMKQTVHDLGGVMSDEAVKSAAAFQDSLQDMQTAFSGLSRGLLADMMPSVTTVMNGLTEIFSGDKAVGLEKLSAGISELISDISDTLPNIIETGRDIISSLVTGITEKLPDLFSLTAEAMLQVGLTLTESIPSLINSGKDLVTLLLNSITEHISDISLVLQDVFRGISDMLSGDAVSEMLDAALALVMSLSQALIDLAPSLFSAATKLVETLAGFLVKALPVLVPQLFKLFYGIVRALTSSELLGSLVKAAIPIVTALADGLLASAPIVYEQLPAIIDELVETIIDCTPELLKAGKELLVHLKNGIIEVFPQLLKAWSELFHVADFASIGSDIVNGIMEWFDTLPERMAEMFVNTLTAIGTWAIEASEKAREAAATLYNNVVEWIKKLPGEIKTLLGDTLPKIVEWGTDLTAKGRAAAKELFDTIVNKVGEIPGEMFEIGRDIVTSIMERLDKLPERIGEMLGKALGAVAKWAVEITQKAKETASEFIENVREFIQQLPSIAKEHLDNMISNVREWADDVTEKAKKTAREFLENIKEYIRQLPSSVKEHLDKTISKVKEWADDLKNKGKKAADDLVEKITSTISSLPDKMAESGRNLVQGLWNGITGAGDWLKSKISEFGGGIIDGFKESFGIHSPSTVMRDQVGKYLAEGIGVGFKENIPDLAAAAQRTVDKLGSLDIPDIDLIKLNVEVPEIELPKLEMEVPELDIDILKPTVDIPEIDIPDLEVDLKIPDIELPKLEIEVPELDVDFPKLTIDFPDIDLPDFSDDDDRKPRVPRIDSSAYQALDGGISSATSSIAPQPTSAVYNNYSYSTNTINNANSGENVNHITFHAHFTIGEEEIAEGFVDIAADKIDEHQGVTVELKKRGLAR